MARGLAQPTEKPEYDAALKQFQSGDFKGAGNAFSAFAKKYPQSPYLPLAQFWLGNSLYAQRDYKGRPTCWNMVKKFPTHPKAPDAMIAIANNQFESGQKAAAKKTLEPWWRSIRDRRRPGREQPAEDAEVTDTGM
jgi:tol-pal system protein YbgF